MKCRLTPPNYERVRIPGLSDYGLPKPKNLMPAPPIDIERESFQITMTQGQNSLILDANEILSIGLDGLKPGKGLGFIELFAVMKNGSKQLLITSSYYTKDIADWLKESKECIEKLFELPVDLDFSKFEDDF